MLREAIYRLSHDFFALTACSACIAKLSNRSASVRFRTNS